MSDFRCVCCDQVKNNKARVYFSYNGRSIMGTCRKCVNAIKKVNLKTVSDYRQYIKMTEREVLK